VQSNVFLFPDRNDEKKTRNMRNVARIVTISFCATQFFSDRSSLDKKFFKYASAVLIILVGSGCNNCTRARDIPVSKVGALFIIIGSTLRFVCSCSSFSETTVRHITTDEVSALSAYDAHIFNNTTICKMSLLTDYYACNRSKSSAFRLGRST